MEDLKNNNNNFQKNNFFKDWISIIIGAIILCYWAFYNNFPVLYSDTGTYLLSGFQKDLFPIDRPIFYGIFMRHISLAASLFLIVFAQGLILSYLIHLLFKVFSKANYQFWSLLSIFILTLFTGASFNVSQLIPDIFTPISILCLLLLLLSTKLNKWQLIFLSVLFVFSNIVHNSHPVINSFILAGFLVYALIQKRRFEFFIQWRRVVLTVSLLAFSFLVFPFTNYWHDRQFVYSESTYMFRLSRLIEMGIVEKFLNKHCQEKNYPLCHYVQNEPEKLWNFLWSSDSPANKDGGWPAHKAEYESLLHDIMSDPEFVILYIQKSIEASFQQFFSFETGDAIAFPIDSGPGFAIQKYFKHNLREFISAKQNRNLLDFKPINQHQFLLVLFSLLFLLVLLFKRADVESKTLIIFLLLALSSNAIVCSMNSSVLARYQGRVIWLIPLFSLVILSNLIDTNKIKGLLNNIGYKQD